MKKEYKIIVVLFLLVLLLTACGQERVEERTVVYSAYLDNAVSNDILIRLFADSELEVYTFEPGRFAEGDSPFVLQYAETLNAAKYKEITERIASLEDCKTEAGNFISEAPWITAEANGKTYTFIFGSEVNVWHSYVVNYFLDYSGVKIGR